MADSDGKVEQYLLLAKAARGHAQALADLIGKATTEPGLFTFGELLSLPSVQELRGGEHTGAVSLLELFAYGSWSDYKAARDRLPALSDQQKHKLRLLTIVTMANGVRTLPYEQLMGRLDVSSVRELEDLLITDCFYSGLLRGKLDQERKSLQIEEAFCRDVRPEELGDVAAALQGWLDNARGVLAGIEAKVAYTGEAMAAAERAKAEMEASLENERKSLRTANELAAQQEAAMLGDDSEPGSLAAMDEDLRPSGSGVAGGAGPGPGSGPGRHTKRRR
ncbi:hypothetical protein N2152v2_004655 [Parachlorella kessleri]